jgi:Ca2+-binding RTX toxin-like protein
MGFENLLGSSHNDKLVGDAKDNVIDGGTGGSDTLIGGGGNDTVSYASSSVGVTVDLQNGTGGGDTLNGFRNVIGSAQNDTLADDGNANIMIGGAGNDSFWARGGADTFNGGSGNDNASYSASNAGITIDLGKGTGIGGYAQGNKLISIEVIDGSNFNDRLIGDANDNGLFASSGDDTLIGGAGNDVLWGSSGDDMLIGGAGADELDGSGGNDTVSYAGSKVAITLTLLPGGGAGSGGDAAGDTYTSIENVIGTDGADTLTGNADANILTGGKGADVLNGGGGNDTVSYAGSKVAVTLALGPGGSIVFGKGGDAQGDQVSAIENITGGSGKDVLTGNELANVIEGGAGADILDGGNFSDTVSYKNSALAVTVTLAIAGFGSASGGDATGDKISNFENILGGKGADVLTGDGFINDLNGGAGNDKLTGGGDVDFFLFDAPSQGVDTIMDFAAGIDRIHLDHVGFGLGSAGSASSLGVQLVNGPAPTSGNPTLLYDATAHLSWDPDGTGAAPAVLFAILNGHPSVSLNDFFFS